MVQAVKLIRMNGLGNDFLIYDETDSQNPIIFESNSIQKLSSRDNLQTKGCDQFIIIKKATSHEDAFIEIYNADGSEVFACGNATRCVGLIVSEKLKKDIVTIKTKADYLISKKISSTSIEVNMGNPQFDWDKIPLSMELNTIELPIELEGYGIKPSAASMGNPHIIFFLDEDIKNIDVKKLGTPLEVHPLFPKKTNVNFANIINRNNINLRTFERGVGETLACGTGACATAVAAIRKNLCNRNITINMTGGKLNIFWNETDNNVYMTGNVEFEKELEVLI